MSSPSLHQSLDQSTTVPDANNADGLSRPSSVRSAGWLAERFAVSVRTIQRDVLAAQVAGVPILVTPARRLHDRTRSPRPPSPSAAAR
jgi:hypothetical protein